MERRGTVLIDLGEDHGRLADEPAPSPGSRRVAIRWRAGVLVTLLVLFCLTAAGPPDGRLRATGTLAVPAGSTFFVAGDLLLVSVARAGPGGRTGTLTAYELYGGARRWSVPAEPAGRYSADLVGDVLLIAEVSTVGRGTVTTARSAATGAVWWSRPGRVLRMPDSTIGLGVWEVRSLSGAGRRLEGAVEAVELATGAVRWRLPLSSTAVVQPVPGDPPRVLVVHDTVAAELYDPATGRVVGTGQLPPADYAQHNPRVIAGRLVLRHPDRAGFSVTGYDLPDLTPRWSRPGSGSGEAIRDCGGLACLDGESQVVALDPDTGAERWTRSRPIGWHSIVWSPDILLRPEASGGRTLLAVARGASLEIIGALPAGVVDCRAGLTVLVCRTAPDRLGLWRFRG
ncbi:PQQ-binding-like beta-propeller repeat protein [Micromonospora sp. HM5-17]|uniref:outer membrane protein assembly factor BamB family protein n=1 Tax=Micromonospora sp. HM5-17 TaxID=2487710 RepID=UPI0011CD956E|nr:PQQ-binding-like beta-propeller repeat protein [Micromonospora sp. HM5-17]